MMHRVFATCLLISSVLPAAVIRSNAEPVDSISSAIPPNIDFNSVSGVMWAYRHVSMYVLTGSQNPLLNVRNYADEGLVQDLGVTIASGSGYNLFTTSNSTQATTTNVGLGVSGVIVDNGTGASYWAPGALLAEWNPVPDVPVLNRGIPALDDYSRDMTPGGVLVGFGEDFQFVPPNVLLAGGSKSTATPTLNEFGLALRGVNPVAFGGAPSTVNSAPLQAAVPTAVAVSTAAPTVLTSPATGSTTRTQTSASPAAAPQVAAQQSIATVAEAFMTTSVISTGGSATAAGIGATDRPNLVGNSIIPVDTPEPGTFAAMGLGFALVAWTRLSKR